MHVRNHNKGTILIFRCTQSERRIRTNNYWYYYDYKMWRCDDELLPARDTRTHRMFFYERCWLSVMAKGLKGNTTRAFIIANERMTNTTRYILRGSSNIMENVRQIS